MPAYEYRCENCSTNFIVTMAMAQMGQQEVSCPDCKGCSVTRQYSPFYAKTDRKS